jgi:lipopolysaccharide export system protein LptC
MGLSLSIAAHIAGSGTHGWKASGPRNLARLIRDARRHSARVRLMRTAVPAAAVAGLGAVVLLTWFNPLRALPELPISAANLVVSGTKITMEAPKLTGFTRDNRAYNVTAEAAAQDFTNPSVVELTGIRANIEMQNKGSIDLSAIAGVYNTKSELLTLTQHIILISSDGYEGHLTEATADVRKGSIVSEKPVEMFLPNGKLNANRMEVENNGELLRFGGGVVLNLNSIDSAPSGKSTAADKSASADKSAPADKKGTRR